MKDFAMKTRLLKNQQTDEEEEFSYAKAFSIGIGCMMLLGALYLIAIFMFAM